MKKRDLNAVASRLLLPRLPGFSYTRRLLVVPPVHPIVRGVYLDDSSVGKYMLRPTVFVQALYVPSEDIHFTFAMYLNGNLGEWWDFEGSDTDALWVDLTNAIKKESGPFFKRLGTPAMLALHGGDVRSLSGRCHVLETVAYSHAFVHNWDGAISTLSELRAGMAVGGGLRNWEQALLDRLERMEVAIGEGADAVDRLLADYMQESIRSLKLREYVR